MPPEVLGDKFCQIDITMSVNGRRLSLEVQVEDRKDYAERTLYYWAREFSTALKEGGNYVSLPPTLIVSIVNFKMLDSEDYRSEFQVLEVKRHTQLTDKLAMYFFELPKLPAHFDKDSDLLLWLSLFNANTEEELERIKALEVPEMTQAIEAYHHVTATDEFKELERIRALSRHNEASVLYNAEQRGIQQGIHEGKLETVKNLLRMNMPPDQVALATGLPLSEIETFI